MINIGGGLPVNYDSDDFAPFFKSFQQESIRLVRVKEEESIKHAISFWE
jgi:diaminopimelate decarboxylase